MRSRILAVLVTLTLGATGLTMASAGNAVAKSGGKTIRSIHLAGHMNARQASARARVTAPAQAKGAAAMRSETASSASVNRSLTPRGGHYSLRPFRTSSPATRSAANGPVRTNRGAVLQNDLAFEGVDHFINRYGTDNGNNHFSLEPPDQGICVGNGQIVEPINSVVQVYTVADGTALLDPPLDASTFFGYPPARDRTGNGPPYPGPSPTDPSCMYDKANGGHFIVIDLSYDVDPNTGYQSGPNQIDIAVSDTHDATGDWTLYHMPVQDDGTDGTPNHHCGTDPNYPDDGVTNPNACLGDYPHLGVDSNGIYITTNEYPWYVDGFHGAQLYALPKAPLEAGADDVDVVQWDTATMDQGNPGFTIFPANTTNRKLMDLRMGGTEWFLSSNAAAEANGSGSSDELLTWALTNTQSLNNTLALSLHHETIQVRPYAMPPLSTQPEGPYPLGQCLNDGSDTYVSGGCWQFFAGDGPYDLPEPSFDSSDTRVLTAWYEGGILYGALDTAAPFQSKSGLRLRTNAGIEWFQLAPSLFAGQVESNLQSQGVLRLAHDNVSYPAVAVNPHGVGAMGFTLSGDNHYPSAAYASVTSNSVGPVTVSLEGVGPDDGFTAYPPISGVDRPARWGDYAAATVWGAHIFLANEWIAQQCSLNDFVNSDFFCPDDAHPDGSRTALANWSTAITELKPS